MSRAECVRANVARLGPGVMRWVDRTLQLSPAVCWERFANMRDRRAHVVARRHEVWSVLRDTLGLSYPELASVFGCDHSSIIYAVKRRARGLT